MSRLSSAFPGTIALSTFAVSSTGRRMNYRQLRDVVNRLAGDLELPYIVVGATARDLLLFHVFEIPVTRATADVDFAIAVDSWERFRGLRTALLVSGHFDDGKIEHRIYLKALRREKRFPST